jgi:hypothetical protein
MQNMQGAGDPVSQYPIELRVCYFSHLPKVPRSLFLRLFTIRGGIEQPLETLLLFYRRLI